MKQSNLQFTNPHIEKIDFRTNDIEHCPTDIPVHINIESEINDDARRAIVKLKLCVGNLNDDKEVVSSFYFNGIIAAKFTWDEEIEDPATMLKINGGTVLLSYMRPVLANLTMQAGMKPLHLPFINFTEDE